MNKIWVGCVLTSLFTPLANAQAPLSLEERLAQMEQRLKATEQRAASAEAEIRALKTVRRRGRWRASRRLSPLCSLMIMVS